MSEREPTAIPTGLESVGEERAALTAPASEAAASAVSKDSEKVWTSPEPWAGSIWRALKAAVIGGFTFYSLMRLMGDDTSTGVSVFMGVWTGIGSLSMSRTGSIHPWQSSVVMGGVALGVGVLSAGTALFVGEGASGPASLAAMMIFLGSGMLWFGLRARRATRELADGKRSDRVAPVLISRAELAARFERNQAYNAAETPRVVKRISIGGAIALGIAAFPYVRVFGAEPPELVGAAIFFGAWGAMGLYMRAIGRRAREVAERLGLVCPACQKTYFGTFANQLYQKNIVEIGRCPRCGVRIVTEESA